MTKPRLVKVRALFYVLQHVMKRGCAYFDTASFFVFLRLLVLARRGSISNITNMIEKLKNILRCYAVGMGIKETANTFHLSLLILDDLFLVPLDAKERPILLDIIEDRHERKSIIITSQYPSSSWYDMVGDPTVADVILDRIVHSAHTIELSGESMRKLKAKKA